VNARRCFQGLVLGLTLAQAAATAPRAPDLEARRISVSSDDRDRLRNWRTTWMRALVQARDGGFGAPVAAEGPLLAPDAAIGATIPPDGVYRCRTIKLGSQAKGGLAFVTYPWVDCRIDGTHFAKLAGTQRPAGKLRRDDTGRLLFVGAMALADEAGALPYGRDHERDMIGIVEQIGPRRWRLVIPEPRWESLLDVMDLVPAS
jgi:hypothetical protein